MKEQINYPVKYSVQEVSYTNSNGKNIIMGYIISKCFIINSNKLNEKYRVIFPFNDINRYKTGLSKMIIPTYDTDSKFFKFYKIAIVDNIYDTYKDALQEKNEKNESLLIDLNSLKNSYIFSDYYRLKYEYIDNITACNIYEELINIDTEELEISKELKLNKK